jgi:hypothetical protein
MESKNIARVTFAELDDVKSVMVLVSGELNDKGRAYSLMNASGIRKNSAAMVEARRDILATGELLLSILDEYRRLHVTCECPVTDEQIAQGQEEIRGNLNKVREDAANCGPVDESPEHAAEDLIKMLGASGVQLPPGFDPSALLPGLSTGNGDESGTGLYL